MVRYAGLLDVGPYLLLSPVMDREPVEYSPALGAQTFVTSPGSLLRPRWGLCSPEAKYIEHITRRLLVEHCNDPGARPPFKVRCAVSLFARREKK